MKRLKAGAIPAEVFEALQTILSGEVLFVAQDGRLMQVDITQRRRLADWSEEVAPWSEELQLTLRKQIAAEFSTLSFGRLVLKDVFYHGKDF